MKSKEERIKEINEEHKIIGNNIWKEYVKNSNNIWRIYLEAEKEYQKKLKGIENEK